MTGKIFTPTQAKAALAAMRAVNAAGGNTGISFDKGVDGMWSGLYVSNKEIHVAKIDATGYRVEGAEVYKTFADFAAAYEGAPDPDDFPLGKACDLSGEGGCEACQ